MAVETKNHKNSTASITSMTWEIQAMIVLVKLMIGKLSHNVEKRSNATPPASAMNAGEPNSTWNICALALFQCHFSVLNAWKSA